MSIASTKIIEAARELLKLCGYFVYNLWHVDDVHFMCEQLELPRISDEDAMEVFSIANQQFDGETGVSWPKLEEALKLFLQRRQLMATSYEALCV